MTDRRTCKPNVAGKTLVLAGVAALVPIALGSSMASAQSNCPEGRTMTGACVNPALAASARQSAVIYSQPKISNTAYPVLPVEDQFFRYPNQLNPDQSRPSPAGVGPGTSIIIIF